MAAQPPKTLTANMLKDIAVLAMLFDHASSVFLPYGNPLGYVLRIFGRIAAPVMCYLIAEGFYHTANLKKYTARLLLFALLSHFPYVLCFGLAWSATSVIWGLLLGLIALSAAKSVRISPPVKLAAVAACCLLAYTADWNYISVLWIVSFGLLRGQFKKQMLLFTAIGALLYILPALLRFGWADFYTFGILLAPPILSLYNGQRGRKTAWTKWGFYIFYPAHLVLLVFLRFWMHGGL